jgi:hypothetical protein
MVVRDNNEVGSGLYCRLCETAVIFSDVVEADQCRCEDPLTVITVARDGARLTVQLPSAAKVFQVVNWTIVNLWDPTLLDGENPRSYGRVC